MRMRRNRIQTYYHKKRIITKDSEGSTNEEYGTASSISGESWPASGKAQAEQYGQRLSYIRNMRLDGKYKIRTDEKGNPHYIFEDGTDLQELDGICLYTDQDHKPDYKIISIKPISFPYTGGGTDMSIDGTRELGTETQRNVTTKSQTGGSVSNPDSQISSGLKLPN